MKIHTGDKPYQCYLFGQAFALKNNLTEHMRIHTGNKPYQCRQCNKAFTQSCNCKMHMLVHTDEKPHQRSQCGMAFIIEFFSKGVASSDFSIWKLGHTFKLQFLWL